MNIPTRGKSSVPIMLAALIAVPACSCAAGDEVAPAYTLFMGADLELEHQKSLYRVEDVVGSYFKIRVNGKEEMIPTRSGSARMKIDNSLKLGGTPLELQELKVERAYTPAMDPHRRFQKDAGSASGAAAFTEISTIQTQVAEGNLEMVKNYHDIEQRPLDLAMAQNAYDKAVVNQSMSFQNMGSDQNSAGYYAQQLEIELAKENFDAIEVSLDLSSPNPLDDPYILIIARIHERDTKPGVLRNWIFAQKIDPVEAEPQKIYIKQGGFPIGYDIEDFQVRIYNRGRELPTNLSPKRVDLTREQAQQYLLIEYLAANKEATVPAVPVFGEAPTDLKARLDSGQYSDPFYVKVDASGNVSGTFTDKDCKNASDDPYVQSFVSNVLFAPALDKGKPVPGVARVKLGTLLN